MIWLELGTLYLLSSGALLRALLMRLPEDEWHAPGS